MFTLEQGTPASFDAFCQGEKVCRKLNQFVQHELP